MKHTTVESSNIASVGYDESSRELEVAFKNGATHRYLNVDPRTHAQLLSAKSVGSHFHQHIKGSYKSHPVGETK